MKKGEEKKSIFDSLTENSPETEQLKSIDGFLSDLKNEIDLNEDELLTIDGAMTLFVLKKNSPSELINNLRNQLPLTRSKEVADSVLKKILYFFNISSFEEKITEPQQESEGKNSPNTTLQTLKDRLTNTTLVAPIIKTVSSPEKKTIATSANEPKTVDPYREIPE